MSPCRIRDRTKSSSSILSLGMMMVMGLPIASWAVQPNIRSAAAFQDMITPFKSLLTIASSDDATIAASREGESSGRNDIRVLCPSGCRGFDGRARVRVTVEDPGLRRLMTWVAVALIVTLALGFLVVEMTLRWFGQ